MTFSRLFWFNFFLKKISPYLSLCLAPFLPSYSEGLPRVALETLYLKKPLLVTKVVEELKHFPAWQLLEKPNPGEIAEKIKSILRGAAIGLMLQLPVNSIPITISDTNFNSGFDKSDLNRSTALQNLTISISLLLDFAIYSFKAPLLL